MPGTLGLCSDLPLPAHSSVLVTERAGILARSASVSESGLSTSPPIASFHSLASTGNGSNIWFRTKKCGTGVIQSVMNSTGVSRSRKRKERTIKPSFPGTLTAVCSAAAPKSDGAVNAASAPAEAVFKNARRELILTSIYPTIPSLIIWIYRVNRFLESPRVLRRTLGKRQRRRNRQPSTRGERGATEGALVRRSWHRC